MNVYLFFFTFFENAISYYICNILLFWKKLKEKKKRNVIHYFINNILTRQFVFCFFGQYFCYLRLVPLFLLFSWTIYLQVFPYQRKSVRFLRSTPAPVITDCTIYYWLHHLLLIAPLTLRGTFWKCSTCARFLQSISVFNDSFVFLHFARFTRTHHVEEADSHAKYFFSMSVSLEVISSFCSIKYLRAKIKWRKWF